MSTHKVVCSNCGGTYEARIFSVGMSDAEVWRCESCGSTAFFNLYDSMLGKQRKYVCPCGGKLTEEARCRCPNCNKEVDMEDIKKQVKWWGTSKVICGLVTVRMLDASDIYYPD